MKINAEGTLTIVPARQHNSAPRQISKKVLNTYNCVEKLSPTLAGKSTIKDVQLNLFLAIDKPK